MQQKIQGLSSGEALTALNKHGPNELPSTQYRGFAKIIYDILHEPMFFLLVGSAVVYILIGDFAEGVLLLSFAVADIALVTIQESRTERVLEALRNLTSPRALVIRDGKEIRISGREVVPGDIILLSEGGRVPADGILLNCHGIEADESLLTGESVPVRKIADTGSIILNHMVTPGGDDLPFVYSGSLIIRGQGMAKVLATGINSQIGKIGKSLETLKPEQTLLQKAVARLVRIMAVAGIIVSISVIILLGMSNFDWLKATLAGIAVAMSMLPEEFPMVLIVFLALGAWRLSKQKVLTRRPAVIETLGAATVLCVDKTGTLTLNQMTISQLYAGEEYIDVNSRTKFLPEQFHSLVEYAILASKPRAFDPIDQAMQVLGKVTLIGTEHLHPDWILIHEYELTPGFLAMTQVWEEKGHKIIAAKGAPEAIIDLCHLPASEKEKIQNVVKDMAKNGLRVIAVAKGRYKGEKLPENQHDFDFAFSGLIGLSDPVRDDVPNAIAECRNAGIKVAMITGDYPETARKIASDAGLKIDGGIMTGAELSSVDESELTGKIKEIKVFARIMPEQKLRIVNAFKAAGEIVAMTGDGVNDAPALKAAHIGIAMGGRGTDVAREASSLVLLDDAFGVIVSAIRQGRRIFNNISKATAFIVAVHIPIAGLSLIPLLFGMPFLFFPAHIVFLEMVIDPVCSIVFENEPEEPDLMSRPPREADAPLFSGEMLLISILQGLGVLAVALTVFIASLDNGENEARTAAFICLVIANLALVITNRSQTDSIIKTITRKNLALWIVIAVTLLSLLIVTTIQPIQELFLFASISLKTASLALFSGLSLIFWFEIVKRAMLGKFKK